MSFDKINYLMSYFNRYTLMMMYNLLQYSKNNYKKYKSTLNVIIYVTFIL